MDLGSMTTDPKPNWIGYPEPVDIRVLCCRKTDHVIWWKRKTI